MRTSRVIRRWWWVFPAALLVVGLVREQQAIAAALVDWSEFELERGVYFPPESTAEQRALWRADIDAAKQRLVKFYGPLRAHPKLIFSDVSRLTRFTNNSTGVTHYQPTGAITIVGPPGQNVDVLAHELAHAELFARLGYWKIEWCVPTWFDEGLAVQFDERPFYQRDALFARMREGWKLPPLGALASKPQFFEGERDVVRFHYAWARAAIADWLDAHSRQAALVAIEAIDCSEPGDALIKELERAPTPSTPETIQR